MSFYGIGKAGGSVDLRRKTIVGYDHDKAMFCEPVHLWLRHYLRATNHEAAAMIDKDLRDVSTNATYEECDTYR